MKRKPPKIQPETNDDDDDVAYIHHQRKLRYLKARRNLRKLEIMMASLRWWARLISWGLVSFLIWYLVHSSQWSLNPDIFRTYPNPWLDIRGNEVISDSQIMKRLANIQFSEKQLYRINTGVIDEILLKLTPVRKVTIRRYWFPARIQITIDEKRPVLSITPSPKINPAIVFNDDKSIIEKEFLPLHYSKPVYKVLSYDDARRWSHKQINFLLQLSEFIESDTGRRLHYLDIRNPDDVYAELGDLRLRLGELDGERVFTRTRRIRDIMTEALKIREQISYIDLRWDKNIFIKLKSKNEKTEEQDKNSKDGINKPVTAKKKAKSLA